MIAIIQFFCFLCGYAVAELLFMMVAKAMNITDKPNHRSSHQIVTVRGGGILFPLSFVIALFITPVDGSIFLFAGICGLAFISFMDDIKSVDSKIRFMVQVCVVALLVWQKLQDAYAVAAVIVFVAALAWINIFNFMDGINGLTGMYSIVTIGSFYWINTHIGHFLPDIYFVSILAALFAFCFFNVRKVARCFSGDVGSISIAYVIFFFMIPCCALTGSYVWLAMVGLYAIDGGFTILCRLSRSENLFEAHRSHFYQFLANDLKLGHITVSSIYAGVQFVLNILVILSYFQQQPLLIIGGLFVFLLIYITFRLHFEGRKRLFVKY